MPQLLHENRQSLSGGAVRMQSVKLRGGLQWTLLMLRKRSGLHRCAQTEGKPGRTEARCPSILCAWHTTAQLTVINSGELPPSPVAETTARSTR